MPANPNLPSLDAVRAELDGLLAEQERRAVAFDNRAGLILGFGGALIGLTAADPSVMRLCAQIAAAAAAGLAGWSLWPRVSATIDPLDLRNRYLTTELKQTKLTILDTRIRIYKLDEERLEDKVARLRWAACLLASSVLFLLIGAILDYTGD